MPSKRIIRRKKKDKKPRASFSDWLMAILCQLEVDHKMSDTDIRLYITNPYIIKDLNTQYLAGWMPNEAATKIVKISKEEVPFG